jgi:Tol biopolymer transport system component
MERRQAVHAPWLTVLTFWLAVGAGELAAQRASGAELAPQLIGDSPLATPHDELNSAFTPDGRTVYFSQNLGERFGVILVARHGDGKWSTPEVASFSGRYSDYDPFVSPDGSQLFWISNRPVNGKEKADYDIWMVQRTGEKWGEPVHLDSPVNTDAEEFYPTVAANGNLYFSSTRPGGKGRGDIYRAKPGTGGGYRVPENLGDSVNSAAFEGDPYIAPDESYIVFSAYGRPDAVGDGDLYVSSMRGGVWAAARPLGHGINSKAREYCPIVSPDGKWFYFTSYRGFIDVPRARSLTLQELRTAVSGVLNGLGNVYRIPASALLPAE